MRNLAGDKQAGAWAALELQLAGVEIVPADVRGEEVECGLIGKLGDFTFRRAWYYWVVTGPMPLAVAQALYDEHEIVRRDVRAAGHCCRLRPGDPGATADLGFLDCYHVDSQEGLTLLCEEIRRLQAG